MSRLTAYTEVYDTILHSKVVYRTITHRDTHKPDIPKALEENILQVQCIAISLIITDPRIQNTANVFFIILAIIL